MGVAAILQTSGHGQWLGIGHWKDVLVAVCQLRLDPAVMLLSEDLLRAASGLLTVLDDAQWARKVPDAATALAVVGPSKK